MKRSYTSLLLSLLSIIVIAQTPQLEISGFIQSDSLAGSGTRNVVADANGLLKIDSNSVTSSLIELRDSTGDLKFRIDADRLLFQMLDKGEVVRFFQYLDTVIVDSTQLARNEGAFTDNPAFIINDARSKLLSIKAKVEAAFPGYTLPIPPPFDTTTFVCTDGFVGGANYDWKSNMGSFRTNITDEAVYRFITVVTDDPGTTFRVDFDDESPGNEMIRIELLDQATQKEVAKDLDALCNSQTEQTIDRSGGDDTKTLWKNGDGTKSTTVTGGSIETSDFSGTPKSNIISPSNLGIANGTDITILDPFGIDFRSGPNSISLDADPATNKFDGGAADLCINSLTQTSDSRLKSNIESLGSVLSDLMRLQPKSYKYSYPKARDQYEIGLIAQDVQKIYPHLVSLNESPHPDISNLPYLTMNYIGLIPILTKGIQEMEEEDSARDLLLERLNQKSEQVDHLSSKLEAQGLLIKKLVQRIDQLESKLY